MASKDGWSVARIEEEVVVTETGREVIMRFPAEESMVAGVHCYTFRGQFPTARGTSRHLTQTSRILDIQADEAA